VKLTPLDIRKQEFKKSMRGFDPEEVEAFLIMVADEMELLLREKNQLNDELIKLRTQLRDYQQVEHTLRDTLMKATNTVEESRMNSLREAELRIHEAELQAEKIIEQAKEELQELRSEINLVKAQKESFSRRLRHLLQSQIELLDVLGMDDTGLNTTDNESTASFTPRGRLPRPVIAATEEEKAVHKPAAPPAPRPLNTPAADETAAHRPAAPPHPPVSSTPPDEPRIVRGERRFDEPYGGRMQGNLLDEEETNSDQDESTTGKNNDSLSDQIVI